MRIPTTAATILAAAGLALGVAAAPASASVKDFTVPGGAAYVQVDVPVSHGPVSSFEVWYAWDNYRHKVVGLAPHNIEQIDNYTGQNPDTGAKFDGCSNNRQPDELYTWDNDRHGLAPGSQPHTSLHHNVLITFKALGSGRYLLWCHFEHGPETWVVLVFADGMQVSITWAQATNIDEILIDRGGTVTSVSPVPADE